MDQQQQQQATTAAATTATTSPASSLIVGIHIPLPVVQGEGRTTTNTTTTVNRDAYQALKLARQDGFDFCTTLLAAPNDNSSHSNNNNNSHSTTLRSDVTTLESQWWGTSIVGVLDTSTWSASSFASQLQWAWHMNLPAVLLPPIPLDTTTSSTTTTTSTTITLAAYAQTVQTLALQTKAESRSSSGGHLWIPVPLTAAGVAAWTSLVRMLDGCSNVGVLLQFQPIPTATATTTTSTTSTTSTFSSAVSTTSTTSSQKAATATTAAASTSAHVASLFLAEQLQLLHGMIGQAVLRCIGLPTAIFLTNAKGYPTLSRAHQILFTMAMKRLGTTVQSNSASTSVKCLLTGPALAQHCQQPSSTTTTTATTTTGCLPYLQYIHHLRTRPAITAVIDEHPETALSESWYDVLQRPLQPLRDHLENGMYETFEKDPVKYTQYQKAIYMALTDKIVATASKNHSFNTIASSNNSNNKNNAGILVILVVGAGRGPLVTCAMNAYDQLCAELQQQNQHVVIPPLQIFAVEKNPSAVVYLQSMAMYDPLWRNNSSPGSTGSRRGIEIISCDLRTLSRDKHLQNCTADIVVSELLGSFGCNELSAECLDDLFVHTDCCRVDTVSIPSRYTSHICPVVSLSLHQQARMQALYPFHNDDVSGNDGIDPTVTGLLRAMETPYVVRPHAASQMHPEQDCWTFVHPTTTSTTCATSTAAAAAAATTTTTTLDRFANSINDDGDDDLMMQDSMPNNTAVMQQQQPQVSSNDKNLHVSLDFTPHAVSGCGYGCGYGAVDTDVAQFALVPPTFAAAAATAATSPSRNKPSADSTLPLPAASPVPQAWTITGLLGTFTADLYSNPDTGKQCQISTAPSRFSVGMFSWFPLYFPLRDPMMVPAGATVRVHLWRRANAITKRVWYEWSVTTLLPSGAAGGSEEVILSVSPIHNPGGRSYHVSM